MAYGKMTMLNANCACAAYVLNGLILVSAIGLVLGSGTQA